MSQSEQEVRLTEGVACARGCSRHVRTGAGRRARATRRWWTSWAKPSSRETYPVGSILPGDDPSSRMRFKVSRTVLARSDEDAWQPRAWSLPSARVGTRVTEKNLWNMFDSEIIAWHFDDGVDRRIPAATLRHPPWLCEPFAAGLVGGTSRNADDIATLRAAGARYGCARPHGGEPGARRPAIPSRRRRCFRTTHSCARSAV